MRLLFITSQYPPLIGGGASRIYDFARIIALKGHSCFVVTYVPLRLTRLLIPYELREGVHVFRFPSLLPRNPIDQVIPVLLITLCFGLTWRPRVVIMSLPAGEPAIGAFLGSNVARLGTIFDVRDEWEDAIIKRRGRRVKRLQYRFYKTLFSAFLSRANLVIGVTPALVRYLQARGSSRIRLIPNGADTDLFQPMERDATFLREHPYIERNDFLIIYAGHLGWYYRLDIVLRAIAQIRSRHPEKKLKLIVMGDGEKRTDYMQLTEKLGLVGQVVFTGDLIRTNVAIVMNRCDLGVIPYDDDAIWTYAYPTKIFEHCAAGLPTVVSIVGGSELEKLVNEYKFGIVVNPLSVEDFAGAIETIMTSTSLRDEMRKNARMTAVNRFSRQKTAEELLAAIDEGL